MGIDLHVKEKLSKGHSDLIIRKGLKEVVINE